MSTTEHVQYKHTTMRLRIHQAGSRLSDGKAVDFDLEGVRGDATVGSVKETLVEMLRVPKENLVLFATHPKNHPGASVTCLCVLHVLEEAAVPGRGGGRIPCAGASRVGPRPRFRSLTCYHHHINKPTPCRVRSV
jgi:hypothetical protein